MNYQLNNNDFEDYKDLFLYSFNYEENEAETNFLRNEFKKSIVYGLKEDNQLMTSVTCIPYETNFFGKKFQVNGIGNVMSAPEYSKNNGINTLMDQAFLDMYNNNVTLSYLEPFSYDYYRRFGYEQTFERLRIEVPFDKVIKLKKSPTAHIKRFKFSKAKEIVGEIFERHNTYGGVMREEWWWNNLPFWYGKRHLAVTFDDAGQINGYLIYSFKDHDFVINEMVYETASSFVAILHFINKHRSIYRHLIVESTDMNLKANVFSSNPLNTKTIVEPNMMTRIINLKRFMVNYPLQEQNLETLRIKVKDDLSWNNHIWKLSINNGEVKFVEADDENYDISLSIQSLTKAMFGFQTLQELYLLGNVKGDWDQAVKLDQIFVHEQAQMKEAF